MSTRRTLDLRHAALPEVQRARRGWIAYQGRKARRILQELDDIDHRAGDRATADQLADVLLRASSALGAALHELIDADLAD